MPRLLAALLLSATLLAGCSGKDSSVTTDNLSQAAAAIDVKATATTGVIRGVVVDTGIRPVPGVLITTQSKGKTVTTNTTLTGAFGFEGLPAGTYFLKTHKLGYTDTQSSTDVVAGVAEPQAIRIELQADGSTAPYFLQTHHKGFISCGGHTANFVWGTNICDPTGAGGFASGDDSHPRFLIDAPPRYLQTEIVWQSSQTLGDQLTTIESPCDSAAATATCYGNTGSSGDKVRLCDASSASPMICRIDGKTSGSRLADGSYNSGDGVGLNDSRLGQGDRSGFEVAVYAGCYNGCVIGAVGGGVELEQPFDVYNTYFYGYQPDATWSFAHDGEVPPPPK